MQSIARKWMLPLVIMAVLSLGIAVVFSASAEDGKTPATNPVERPVWLTVAKSYQAAGSNEEPTIVTVDSGDSLADVAKQHRGATMGRIFSANPGLKNPYKVEVARQLIIPEPEEELQKRPLPEMPKVELHQKVPDRARETPGPQPESASQTEPPDPEPAQQLQHGSYDQVWDRLAQCESGGNWQANTGNGFYGGLQFTVQSWRAVGGQGIPHHASKAEQIARAKQLRAKQGWGAWPACSRKLGLR